MIKQGIRDDHYGRVLGHLRSKVSFQSLTLIPSRATYQGACITVVLLGEYDNIHASLNDKARSFAVILHPCLVQAEKGNSIYSLTSCPSWVFWQVIPLLAWLEIAVVICKYIEWMHKQVDLSMA